MKTAFAKAKDRRRSGNGVPRANPPGPPAPKYVYPAMDRKREPHSLAAAFAVYYGTSSGPPRRSLGHPRIVGRENLRGLAGAGADRFQPHQRARADIRADSSPLLPAG